MFRAVLFREVIRIAEIFHQKANQISLTNERISKMWPIHPTEYYSAIKRHEVLIHALGWMDVGEPGKHYAK